MQDDTQSAPKSATDPTAPARLILPQGGWVKKSEVSAVIHDALDPRCVRVWLCGVSTVMMVLFADAESAAYWIKTS